MRLFLGLACGLAVGASVQCGGPGVLQQVGLCTSDSDCVIDCDGGGCCKSDCPCGQAVTRAEQQRRRDESRNRCADIKIECEVDARNACDWNAQHRAVCRSGSCVAEPVDGGIAAEHRPPPMPATITTDDPNARRCLLARDGRDRSCMLIQEWDCGGESECRMGVPCDPANCERTKTVAVGLDAEPWATALAGPRNPPADGVLLFVAGSDYRAANLFVADTPSMKPTTTTIAVDPTHPYAAWIDGSPEALVFRDKSIVRVGFGAGPPLPMFDDVIGVSGLDVSPKGDTLAVAIRRADASGLQTFDLATWTAKSVPGANAEDGAPRWSPDGRRLAYARFHLGGGVAISDLETGRVDGRATESGFLFPTWHPSGTFFAMWLPEPQADEAGCRLVLVTADRSRYAPTHIWERGGYCRAFALSPDGDYVALWRWVGETQRLQVEPLLAGPPAITVGEHRHGGAIDWTTGFTVRDLGIAAN